MATFSSYTLSIGSLSSPLLETYNIYSESEEQKIFKVLTSKHQILSLDVSKSGKSRCYQQLPHYFSLNLTLQRTLLFPKLATQESHGLYHKDSYANGVVEEYLSGDSVRTRTYSDGTIEKGIFDARNLQLLSGYRLSDGRFTYFDPEMVCEYSVNADHDRRRLGIKIHFARIVIDSFSNAKRIALIQGVNPQFTLYEGSVHDALFKFARCPLPPHSFTQMLTYAEVDTAHFWNYLLKPHQIVHNSLPLFFIQAQPLLELLKRIQKEGLEVNLRLVDGDTTFFNKWLRKGSLELIELILELDPSVIHELAKEAVIAKAYCQDQIYKVALLLKTADQERAILHPNDEWIRRAVSGDNSFSDQDFDALDSVLQDSIYEIANMHRHEALILRLSSLLKVDEEPVVIEVPNILPQNRDFVYAKNAIQDFLLQLRTRKLLLTEEEFLSQHNIECFIPKQRDAIYRLVGKDLLEQNAKKRGWKFIKAPIEYAVQKSNSTNYTVSLVALDSDYVTIEVEQLKIYSEKIETADRELEKEEADELLDALEALNFRDAHPRNFIVGKEGTYFIDLELMSFTSTPYLSEWKKLTKLVHPNYREEFETKLTATFEKCAEKIRLYEEQMGPRRKENLKRFGYAGMSPFTLPLVTNK